MRQPGRSILLCVACAAAMALPWGCIRHEPAGPEAQEALAFLSVDPFPSVPAGPAEVGGRSVPTVWTLQRGPEPPEGLRGYVVGQIEAGAPRVVVPVSLEQAHQAQHVLEQARQVMLDIRSLAQAGPSLQRRRWARTVARTLVGLEGLIRHAERTGQTLLGSPDQPEALQAVSALIHGQARQEMLGPAGPQEPGQLRRLLSGVVLRVSFALARKALPDGLEDEAALALAGTDQPDLLQQPLEQRLEQAIAQAPPAPPNDQLRQVVEKTLSIGPPLLAAAASLVSQWDRFESVQFEYRKLDGRALVAVTSTISPGATVRGGGGFFQPELVLRGQVRTVFEPPSQPGDWMRVHFEPLSDDSVLMVRFAGLDWAIVRLLAIPVEDLELREVRIASGRDGDRHYLTVQVYAAAVGGKSPGGDRRRMLCIQQESIRPLVRRPMELAHPTVLKTTMFSYVRPDRQYVFRRTTKGQTGPK